MVGATADSIVKVFTATIAKLDKHADAQDKKAEQIQQKISVQQTKRQVALGESIKARGYSKKINSIFSETDQ